jgi:hypothetical protein
MQQDSQVFERFIKMRHERSTRQSTLYSADTNRQLGFVVLKSACVTIHKSGVATALLKYPDRSEYGVELLDVTHTDSRDRPRWKGTYQYKTRYGGFEDREFAVWTYEDEITGEPFVQFEHRQPMFAPVGRNNPSMPVDRLFR